MDQSYSSFREKLDQEHSFPGTYVFKFIAPSDKIDEIKSLLPPGELSFRQSSSAKYTSVTLQAQVNTSDEVVKVYLSMKDIKGVIAL